MIVHVNSVVSKSRSVMTTANHSCRSRAIHAIGRRSKPVSWPARTDHIADMAGRPRRTHRITHRMAHRHRGLGAKAYQPVPSSIPSLVRQAMLYSLAALGHRTDIVHIVVHSRGPHEEQLPRKCTHFPTRSILMSDLNGGIIGSEAVLARLPLMSHGKEEWRARRQGNLVQSFDTIGDGLG